MQPRSACCYHTRMHVHHCGSAAFRKAASQFSFKFLSVTSKQILPLPLYGMLFACRVIVAEFVNYALRWSLFLPFISNISKTSLFQLFL
jgi:hypothetical protein